MRLDTKKLLKDGQKDYERTWAESAKLLKVRGKYFTLVNKRKQHIFFDLIIKARNVFLEMGFAEVITPLITEERHVYLQYGSEAPVILDRVFLSCRASKGGYRNFKREDCRNQKNYTAFQ